MIIASDEFIISAPALSANSAAATQNLLPPFASISSVLKACNQLPSCIMIRRPASTDIAACSVCVVIVNKRIILQNHSVLNTIGYEDPPVMICSSIQKTSVIYCDQDAMALIANYEWMFRSALQCENPAPDHH